MSLQYDLLILGRSASAFAAAIKASELSESKSNIDTGISGEKSRTGRLILLGRGLLSRRAARLLSMS